MPDIIQLLAKSGSLYSPFEAITDASVREFYGHNRDGDRDPILLVRHDEGDVSVAHWPNVDHSVLADALFAAREIGCLPSATQTVLLPDGTLFGIDTHCMDAAPERCFRYRLTVPAAIAQRLGYCPSDFAPSHDDYYLAPTEEKARTDFLENCYRLGLLHQAGISVDAREACPATHRLIDTGFRATFSLP